jgi:hypothetical protein
MYLLMPTSFNAAASAAMANCMCYFNLCKPALQLHSWMPTESICYTGCLASACPNSSCIEQSRWLSQTTREKCCRCLTSYCVAERNEGSATMHRCCLYLRYKCRRYVRSVILGDDLVPRLNVTTISRLREEIKASDWRPQVAGLLGVQQYLDQYKQVGYESQLCIHLACNQVIYSASTTDMQCIASYSS